jgi:hypothetical protein
MDDGLRVQWLAATHEAVRNRRGRVLGDAVPPTVGRNYYAVTVELPDQEPSVVLLNAACRLVGAAAAAPGPSGLRVFRDVPASDAFTVRRFDVALAVDLERPWTDPEVAHLDVDERRDIAYHQPPRVGDIAFNWFD